MIFGAPSASSTITTVRLEVAGQARIALVSPPLDRRCALKCET